MLIKTVTTVTALNSAGQLVEALPVRTAVAGETDIVGRPVTPISVTEDPFGVPVRFVMGKSAVNSAGQVVDTIPVSGGAVPVPKIQNARFGLIGPSTAEHNHYGINDAGGLRSGAAASGPLTWAMMESRRGSLFLTGKTSDPYFIGDNRAKGGAGFADYPAQISGLAARMSSTPAAQRVAIYEPGRNDLQSGLSVADYKTFVLRDVADMRARGFALIFITKIWKKPTAYGGVWASGQPVRGYVDEINAWLETLVAADLKLIDFPAFLTDPSSPDGNPYPNVTRSVDYTHITNYGGRLGGKAVEAALAPYIEKLVYPASPAENLFPSLSGTGGTKTGTGVSGSVVDGWDVNYSGASGSVVCAPEVIDGKTYQKISASQLSGIAATGANIIMSRAVNIPANKKTGARVKAKIKATAVPYMLFFGFGSSSNKGVSPNTRTGLIAGVANLTAQTVIGGAGSNFQGAVKFDGSEDLDLWIESPSYIQSDASALTSIPLSLTMTVAPSANANLFEISIGDIQTFDWPL